jgi:hypothetical protein
MLRGTALETQTHMATIAPGEVTQLLRAWNGGDEAALDWSG